MIRAARYLGIDYRLLEDRPYMELDRILVVREMENYAAKKAQEKAVKEAAARRR